jgi:hypothetical protein
MQIGHKKSLSKIYSNYSNHIFIIIFRKKKNISFHILPHEQNAENHKIKERKKVGIILIFLIKPITF